MEGLTRNVGIVNENAIGNQNKDRRGVGGGRSVPIINMLSIKHIKLYKYHISLFKNCMKQVCFKTVCFIENFKLKFNIV